MKAIITLSICLMASFASMSQVLTVNNGTSCTLFMHLVEINSSCGANVTLVAVAPGTSTFTSMPGYRWDFVRGIADVYPYTACTTPLYVAAPWTWCHGGIAPFMNGPQCTCLGFLNAQYTGVPAAPVLNLW